MICSSIPISALSPTSQNWTSSNKTKSLLHLRSPLPARRKPPRKRLHLRENQGRLGRSRVGRRDILFRTACARRAPRSYPFRLYIVRMHAMVRGHELNTLCRRNYERKYRLGSRLPTRCVMSCCDVYHESEKALDVVWSESKQVRS